LKTTRLHQELSLPSGVLSNDGNHVWRREHAL
jgi:hypothetical protein